MAGSLLYLLFDYRGHSRLSRLIHDYNEYIMGLFSVPMQLKANPVELMQRNFASLVPLQNTTVILYAQ